MSESGKTPIVAVDAMGGDVGPTAIVPGALEALANDGGFGLRLYGESAAIEAELERWGGADLPVEIVACDQIIEMDDSPAAAVRGKPDAPVVKAMRDQAEGKVQAVVSAGSTGATVAASLLILGRLPGVDRPAIATVVPCIEGEVLLVDAGANVQCSPEHLLAFARMGAVYAREMLVTSEPTVGLLNIGEEASKGSELTTAAHGLLKDSDLNFIGNVESNRILFGSADVVVTDGFTGNVVLKLTESLGFILAGLERTKNVPQIVREALPPVLSFLQERFSYEKYGGALLLGIAGVSIIAHGRSTSRAIASAVRVARRQVDLAIPERLQAALSN